ncbi:MAG: hypothetical protein WC626_10855 [Methanoregula sp.]
MARLKRKDIIFVQTSLQIPETLRDNAREQGIGLSSTLTDALEVKLKEGNAGAKQLPTHEAPCTPSSTDKQVDV